MARKTTLYSFGPSHYCEKARWALDLSGLDYREVCWAPGVHVLLSRRIAPRSSVPILRGADGTIQGSAAILTWIEESGRAAWSAPTGEAERAEIERLETLADETMGVAVRRLAYATGLSTEPDTVAEALLRDVAPWQKRLGRLLWPKTRQLISSALQATGDDIPEARDQVEDTLAQVDGLVADGRDHLVGGRLTRADIALASLLSPVVNPPEHPVYPRMTLWAAMSEIIAPWQERPSLRWAARLYHTHRAPAAAPAA